MNYRVMLNIHQKNKNVRLGKFLACLIFFTQIALALDVHAAHKAAELPVYSRVYDERRDPNVDGRQALKLAAATQRKVLIEVGGNWCSWCHVLDGFITQHHDVEKRLHETFVVLKVSISDENDNAEFMSAFPPAQGYPHMYITDSSGTILHSQDTSEFRENKKYSEKHFMIFFDRWEKKND